MAINTNDLNHRLKDNPYANIIIPLIKHLNQAGRIANPWEELTAALILKQRSITWGLGYPYPEPEIISRWFTGCWCPDRFGLFGYRWVSPCSACITLDDDDNTEANAPRNELTLEQFIGKLTRDDKSPTAFTSVITAFKRQIGTLDTNRANGYAFFQQIIDVFFENVNFIPYFLNTYKDGFYKDAIMSLIGGRFREGVNTSGIVANMITDGVTVVTATTRVFVGETGAPVGQVGDAPYFTVFDAVDSEYVFWMEIDGNYVQPSPPVGGGVIQTFHQITLPASTAQDTIGIAVADAIIATGVFAAPTMDGDTVVIDAGTAGAGIQAGQFDYTAPDSGLPNGSKEFTFADGVDGVDEVAQINFRYTNSPDLSGQWFKLYDVSSTDGELFYYEYDGETVDPVSLGPAYDDAHAIELAACPPPGFEPPCSAQANNYIQTQTDTIVVGTTLFILAPVDTDHISRYQTVALGAASDIEGGTANYGEEYMEQDVIAPDGTNFGTAQDDDDYARIWNAQVYPHMLALNERTFYMKPVSAGRGPRPCRPCTPTPCGDECYDVSGATASTRLGSLILQTNYISLTEDMAFNASTNTNPNVVGISIKDVCQSCFW